MGGSWGKVAVALRCGGKPDAMFLQSWTRLLVSGLRVGDLVLTPAIELPHHYAATILADAFIKSDCDSVLFVDDDMVFPKDSLSKLRDNESGMEFDAVAGLTLARSAPHHPVLVQHHDAGTYKINNAPEKDKHYECAYLGLAFTLIRRKVLEDSKNGLPKGEMLFTWRQDGTSEDAHFFLRAGKLGFRFAVDTGVMIGHRVSVVVVEEFGRGVAYQEADPIKVRT